MKQSSTWCSCVCSGSNELNFRCASPKGFCFSLKQQEKGLVSSYCPDPSWRAWEQKPWCTPQTGSHQALSISFVFVRCCLIIVLWRTALLWDRLLWLKWNEGDCLFSSSYLFLQCFGYPNSWETTCRAVWVAGKKKQLPVTRGVKKSSTGNIEQVRKSRF